MACLLFQESFKDDLFDLVFDLVNGLVFEWPFVLVFFVSFCFTCQ